MLPYIASSDLSLESWARLKYYTQPEAKTRRYIAHLLAGFVYTCQGTKQHTASVKINEATLDNTSAYMQHM